MSEFKPTYFKGANIMLNGRELSEKEKEYYSKGNIQSIPCYKDGTVVITQWRIGFFSRLKFLLTGEIFVTILGITQPPISIQTNNPLLNNKL